MYVVTVAPLSRGLMTEELTYFSARNIRVGALVEVPIQRRVGRAVVLSCEDAREHKGALRSSDYALKKIEADAVLLERFLRPSFVAAAQDTARAYIAPIGATLSHLLPTVLIDEAVQRGDHLFVDTGGTIEASGAEEKICDTLRREVYVFQSDDTERMSTYKSVIREAFARRSSVFFCLPSVQDIEYAYATLERGIDAYTFVLHSGISKREIMKRLTEMCRQKHPVLIIATPQFLCVNRHDVDTIILDRESSHAYRTIQRPYIDFRVFAERLARHDQVKMIIGDFFLRLETIYAKDEGRYEELAPLKYRILSTAQLKIIDMKPSTESAPGSARAPFAIFSKEVRQLIEKSHENNEVLFLYTARRGRNPITACADCGTVVECSHCSAPMALHHRGNLAEAVKEGIVDEQNVFICHKCGTRKSSMEKCARCGGWNLVPLGIGTQLIEEKISERYPNIPLFRIDSDNVKSLKKGSDIFERFTATPGSILIGTDKALPYVRAPIHNIAVISIDSLFALPDFRAHERIITLLFSLYVHAIAEFYVQTRNRDSRLFTYLERGNALDFYRDELKERREFGYPPFKRFIKITLEGLKQDVISHMKSLEKELASYESLVFPAFVQTVKGKYRMHALIKIPASTPVDDTLYELLRSLPPQYIVEVDPEDLL